MWRYGENLSKVEEARRQQSMKNLMFIDLEFNHLETDPTILECAVIVVDDQHQELRRAHWVVGMPRHEIEERVLQGKNAPWHLENSAKNGLLEEVAASTCSLDTLGSELMELMRTYFPEPKTCRLVGNSVHNDKDVLARTLPQVHAHLSHQIVDVTTLMYFNKRHKIHFPRFTFMGHRAVNDVESALRYFLNHDNLVKKLAN